MAEVIDYIRSAGDLVIVNGDFAKGDCTGKHQETLLLAEPGDFKQFPTMGVGMMNFLLNNATSDEVRSAIQKEFEADGMSIKSMTINNTDIIVESEYDQED